MIFLINFFDLDLDFGLNVLSTMNGSQQTRIEIMTKSNTDYMINWDIPGWDYLSVPRITNSFDCQTSV